MACAQIDSLTMSTAGSRHDVCSGVQHPPTGTLWRGVIPKAVQVVGSCICTFMIQDCEAPNVRCRVQQQHDHLLNSALDMR